MNALDAPEAHRLQNAGAAVILDVRDEEEVAYSRIPGSLHIPLFELPDRMAEIPRDRTIVCQCASGGRSAGAAATLLGRGYRAVNLTGGIFAWARAGLPIARGAA